MQSIDIQLRASVSPVLVRCGVGFACNIPGTGLGPWVINYFMVCSRDDISELPLAPTFSPHIGKVFSSNAMSL